MTGFVLRQHFRYEYPAPIRRLVHRLVVVPPEVHGGQRRVAHRFRVEGADASTEFGCDRFGNPTITVRAPVVREAISFDILVETDWDPGQSPGVAPVPASAIRSRWFTTPSRLTDPDAAIVAMAAELGRRPCSPLDLAEAVTSRVHASLRYGFGATTVKTTAADALAAGTGVCQDFAHVMVAMARACGLPARYVSGHLVGEGGSHAWVEVLVADGARPGRALAVAFDPTHDRRAGAGYLTVATGRDYADVAPTSGSYTSKATGRLTCRKRLEIAGEPEPVLASA